MPRSLSSGEIRGSSADDHALRTMSTCSDWLATCRHRPHHVCQIGRIDIVVHHHHHARHVAVRGRDQPRTLGVAVIPLLERHHGHQLRHMLPGADDVGDTGCLQILPDGGGAERQAEMKPRRLHRRRAEQDRIVAMISGGDLHHRAGAGVRRVITGELAERPLRQRHLAGRQQVPLEDDFGVRRHRQAGLRSHDDLDRRALDGAGERVLRLAGRQVFEAGNEQRGVLAVNHRHRAGLALVPVFLGDDRAMPPAMVELYGDLVPVMDLDAVDRGVDPAAVRIAHDDDRAGTDIRAAVVTVPDRCRKAGEVDGRAGHGVRQERRVPYLHRLARLQRLALFHPRLERVERAEGRIEAERQRGALRTRRRVAENAEAARKSLDVVEQQRRAVRHPGRDFGDPADLEPRIGAVDPPQHAEVVDQTDEFAQVLVHPASRAARPALWPSADPRYCRASSGPIPTFAPFFSKHLCECWNQRTTSKFMFLVEFGFDIRFASPLLGG